MDSEDRRVVGTAAAAHATIHAHELSIPVFLSVWLAEYGASPALLGLVVTLAYGLFGAGALPAGVVADRVGSAKLIGASLAVAGVSFALVGAAGWLPLADAAPLGVAGALWAIAVALGLWGAAASAYHPSGLSLLSTAVAERGRGFAFHGAAGNVGIALGPLATIVLLEFLPWQPVAVLLGLFGLLAGGAAFALSRRGAAETPAADPATAADGAGEGADTPDASDPSGASDSSSESDQPHPERPSILSEVLGVRSVLTGPFLALLAVVVFSGLVYRGTLTFLPEVLADLPWLGARTVAGVEIEAARYVYVGILSVGVLGQYAGGRLSDAVDPVRGLAGAFVLLAALSAAFPAAALAGPLALLAVGGLLGASLFVVQPLYQAAVAEHTPEAARGRSYGIAYLCVFGIGALGGALAGWLLTVAAVGTLFVVLAGLAVLASLVAGGLASGRVVDL